MCKRRRTIDATEVARPKERPESKLRRLVGLANDAVAAHPDDETITDILREVHDIGANLGEARKSDEESRAMLGPLASAGMAALAIEHETRKEMSGIQAKLRELDRIAKRSNVSGLAETASELQQWIRRLDATRGIFLPLMDAEDRERIEALECACVVRSVTSSLRPLLGRMRVDFDLQTGLYLPAATDSEWSAILQNVLLNAANATLDTLQPRAEISSSTKGRRAVSVRPKRDAWFVCTNRRGSRTEGHTPKGEQYHAIAVPATRLQKRGYHVPTERLRLSNEGPFVGKQNSAAKPPLAPLGEVWWHL